MIYAKDHKTCDMFDPFSHLGLKRLKMLTDSWPGLFRQELLPNLPVHLLSKYYKRDMGRPTKELYAMSVMTFDCLQFFMSNIIAPAPLRLPHSYPDRGFIADEIFMIIADLNQMQAKHFACLCRNIYLQWNSVPQSSDASCPLTRKAWRRENKVMYALKITQRFHAIIRL